MRILITGAAGFIGFSFSKFLIEKTNHEIIGVDNINDYYTTAIKYKRLNILKKSKKFKFIKLDIQNKKKLDLIFKRKINAVFHFAAQAGVRYSLINPRSFVENNILGFYNILEKSINHKVKKIFYASSSSVYGDNKKFPLGENNLINPKNIYGLSKKINEEISNVIVRNKRISIIGLRFFTVFGEWGRPDMLIFKYLKSSFNKKEKFYLNNYGNHTRDFTYIEDVNKILYSLLIKKHPFKHNIFNICSNKPIKITKTLDLINKNIHLKPKIIKRSFQKVDVKKTHGDNSKVKKYTRISKFTKIELAISNTVKWYKKNWKIFV